MDNTIRNRASLKRAVLDAYYGGIEDDALTELQRQNLQFAISSNERAFNTLEMLEAWGG